MEQENPNRANGQIFNVGNPHNEVTVRELAELMTDVSTPFASHNPLFLLLLPHGTLQLEKKVGGSRVTTLILSHAI